MITPLLLFLLPTASRLESTVTYRTVAKPVKAVLLEVSKQAGVTLVAAPTVENEPVIVSVKDAPLKEFIEKLSDALLCQWKQKGSQLVLELDSGKLRKAEDEENSFRVKYIEQKMHLGMAKVDSQSFEPGALDDLIAGIRKQRASVSLPKGDEKLLELPTPLERLGWRLMASLGAQTLANLKPFQRVVLSPQPKGGELDATEAFARLLPIYNAEARNYVAATERAQMPQSSFNGVELATGDFRIYMELSRTRDQDITGKVVLQVGEDQFLTEDVALEDSRLTEESEREQERLRKGRTIKFSPDSAALMESFSSRERKVSSELRQKVAHPTTFDPLSFGVSDALLQLADSDGKNLIAVVSDEFGYGYQVLPTLEWFLDDAKDEILLDRTGSWIVVTPTKPISSREQRTDRSVLEEIVGKLQQSKFGELELVAQYLFNHQSSRPWNLEADAVPLVTGNKFAEQEVTLLFFGSLTQPQKDQLFGSGLTLRDLAPEQRDFLRAALYVDPGALLPKALQPTREGFPRDLVLKGEDSSEETAAFEVYGQQVAVTPEELTEILASWPTETGKPVPKVFFPSRHRKITFLKSDGDSPYHLELDEIHVTSDKPIALAQFPEAFRKRYEKAKGGG